MMAQHGWRSTPSPRRGFTVVEASRNAATSPVVVAVHDSLQGVRLFRSALDEAIARSVDLVVLDYGPTALGDELSDESCPVDPRERSAMRALWCNPRVRVIRTEPVQGDVQLTVSYCESVEASMLVIAAEHIGATTLDATLTQRIFNGDFDLLVVTDHPTRDRLAVEP